MTSPFKFLDAFTLADKDVFFGREEETEALYQMVFQTPLSLVYGLSGTGKTSLIQCGLAGKFDGPDWYPIWVRRNDDLNDSLKAAVQTALGEHQVEKLSDAISYLFRYYLRPVYLIFDQFEELFILGEWEEQQRFMQDIADLLAAELPCRILFVMREEYLGALYHFEKYVPTLFDFRLRIEPMSNVKVKEVMKSSFTRFNIALEGDEDERCQQMIDNISAGKSGIQLPYLQVYLDMLYREDYQRTFGDHPPEEQLPRLEFTKEEIKEFGQIDDVLGRFLQQQEVSLQNQLKAKFSDFPDDGLRKVLDAFVTESGTKRPVNYQRVGEEVQIVDSHQGYFPTVSTASLNECIHQLEQSRILRATEDSLELAHDSLAALVDQSRSDEQRQLNEIKTRISAAYREYKETGQYLSQKQLLSMEEYLDKLSLEPQQSQFIADSRQAVADRLKAEQEAQTRELQEQKARAEKEQQLRAEAERGAKRAKRFSWLALAITLAAIGLAIFAFNQNSRAHQASAERYMNDENYALALASFEDAQFWGIFRSANFEQLIDSCYRRRDLKEDHESLLALGDTLKASGPASYQQALQAYQHADSLNYNGVAANRITQLQTDMVRQFEIYKEKGEAFYLAEGYGDARTAYQIADQLRPGDPGVQARLKEIDKRLNSPPKPPLLGREGGRIAGDK